MSFPTFLRRCVSSTSLTSTSLNFPQFVGHKIEGAKPSFLEDIQFLLVGPA
jgi:uncharacterized membrane protein YGL010W